MFLSYGIKRIAALCAVSVFAALTDNASAETNVQESVRMLTGSLLTPEVAYEKAMVICEAIVKEQGDVDLGFAGMKHSSGMEIDILKTIKGSRIGTIPVDLSIRTWPPEKPVENVPLKGEKVIMFLGYKEYGTSNEVVKVMAHTPENLKAVQAIKDREKKLK